VIRIGESDLIFWAPFFHGPPVFSTQSSLSFMCFFFLPPPCARKPPLATYILGLWLALVFFFVVVCSSLPFSPSFLSIAADPEPSSSAFPPPRQPFFGSSMRRNMVSFLLTPGIFYRDLALLPARTSGRHRPHAPCQFPSRTRGHSLDDEDVGPFFSFLRRRHEVLAIVSASLMLGLDCLLPISPDLFFRRLNPRLSPFVFCR